MQSFSNKSLKEHNTFGIDVKAKTFISITTVEELKAVLKKQYASEVFILGGGSNMLLTRDINKTVLHINLKGKEIVNETEEEVYVKAMAGETWHEFVLYCISRNFGGLENLSLIPGNVGTTPIQNIGAYGVEIKDTFESCTALNVQTLELQEFSLFDCEFGYRDSVFKNALKGQYIITSVTFRLTKKNHRLNTSYGPIEQHLAEKGVQEPQIKDISDAVISIRQSKLPDPKELGNSGSFFKNPVISMREFEELQENYPELPGYKISEDEIKVPAGWLIDKAGLKGFRKGDAGVHTKQALVLVNYGNATGQDILNLSTHIQEEIYRLFRIRLQPEVNIL
ncbi:UDP-N-acetylmuramate dehydrogenase [Salinimicrobium sp. GXAS 041]|uniref:UDP-N-acetylmuramate dehydrogenase n=1 Tax=Salinimicrobium sp. GXAS 041 TaxID=3400806 RepID=UPI003C783E8F